MESSQTSCQLGGWREATSLGPAFGHAAFYFPFFFKLIQLLFGNILQRKLKRKKLYVIPITSLACIYNGFLN